MLVLYPFKKTSRRYLLNLPKLDHLVNSFFEKREGSAIRQGFYNCLGFLKSIHEWFVFACFSNVLDKIHHYLISFEFNFHVRNILFDLSVIEGLTNGLLFA